MTTKFLINFLVELTTTTTTTWRVVVVVLGVKRKLFACSFKLKFLIRFACSWIVLSQMVWNVVWLTREEAAHWVVLIIYVNRNTVAVCVFKSNYWWSNQLLLLLDNVTKTLLQSRLIHPHVHSLIYILVGVHCYCCGCRYYCPLDRQREFGWSLWARQSGC